MPGLEGLDGAAPLVLPQQAKALEGAEVDHGSQKIRLLPLIAVEQEAPLAGFALAQGGERLQGAEAPDAVPALLKAVDRA